MCTVNDIHLIIAVWQLYTNTMVKQANQVETLDAWLFYEIVGKAKKYIAEDQGEKDASDFRD